MTKLDDNELKSFLKANKNEDVIKNGQPEHFTKKRDTLFLYLTVISGTMLFVVNGGSLVWTSPVLPKITSNNSDDNPIGRTATTFEVSLLGGLPSLSLVIGALVLGNLSELIGRKLCLQMISIGMLLSIIALSFSNSIILIIICRCFIYFFINGVMTVYPIYLTEICEDHNRAKYGCLMGACMPLGNLFGYALGSVVSIRLFTFITASPLVLFTFFFLLAPESPVYSLSKGRRPQCITALNKLRSNKSQQEINFDLQKIEETIKSKATGQNSSMFALFITKERRYAMMLAGFPPLIQLFSGVAIVLQFLAPLFNEAGTKLDGNQMAIVVGLVKLASFLFTSFIIEKTGRRSMLLISSVGSGFPMLTLALFFHLKHLNSPLIPYLQWLPLTCLICFVIMYSLGLGPVPMAIMGELFTPDIRASAVSFIMTVTGIGMFFITSSYPYMVEFLGMQWCIGMYGIFSLCGFVFIYIFIPETKGKSLIDIQEYIKKCCNK